jgi:predicted HNH restriction endonuclease
MYAVIAENDESQWSDETGVLYHFPKRYKSLLLPGTRVVYYKGRLRSSQYKDSRLSAKAHYFGAGVIGKVYADRQSEKGDLFATINDFQAFTTAVVSKQGDSFLEVIPANRVTNYWKDGVRALSQQTYELILQGGAPVPVAEELPPTSLLPLETDDLSSAVEGQATRRYVTTYERNPRNRRQALAIHGYRCKACEEDMEQKYGKHAAGLIHIHHVVPVSEYDVPKRIDPELDLVPVCPNCHSVIHHKKKMTLTVEAVREMLKKI